MSEEKKVDEVLEEEVVTETAEKEESTSEADASQDVEKTADTQAEENTSTEEETTTGDSEEQETAEKEKKKKPFGKKKDKKDEQIEELNDKYQRLFAEFQNFRSRSEKEKQSMYDMGARSIIEKILPIIDNFERGVAALSEEDLGSTIGQGMDLIYKQMTSALTDMGVEVIEAEGAQFDPELHNAVMHEDNDEFGENIISQEFQKGYKYKETVIRHSMVKVAN